LQSYDAVVIATNHQSVSYQELAGLVAVHCGHAQRDGWRGDPGGTSLESVNNYLIQANKKNRTNEIKN